MRKVGAIRLFHQQVLMHSTSRNCERGLTVRIQLTFSVAREQGRVTSTEWFHRTNADGLSRSIKVSVKWT